MRNIFHVCDDWKKSSRAPLLCVPVRCLKIKRKELKYPIILSWVWVDTFQPSSFSLRFVFFINTKSWKMYKLEGFSPFWNNSKIQILRNTFLKVLKFSFQLFSPSSIVSDRVALPTIWLSFLLFSLNELSLAVCPSIRLWLAGSPITGGR